MAFLNAPTAARVANSAAKSAAQVTRGLSMASRAKEKKSRRFFPAAVFSGRDGRPTFLRNTRLDRTEAPREMGKLRDKCCEGVVLVVLRMTRW